MRFDKRITFVRETESYYDPVKGEFVDGEPVKTTLPCHLSGIGIDRTNQLFGELDLQITVARLQNPYHGKIDHVLIDEQKYQIKRHSNYRKGVFYLEGIPNG